MSKTINQTHQIAYTCGECKMKYHDEASAKKCEAELLEALRRDGVETVGAVNVARYNTPWTIPFMLRNEVQIEVK